MEHNIIVKQEFDAESVSSIGLSTHAEKVKLEDETEENLVIPKDEVEYNEHMDFGAYASDVDGVSTMIKNETLDIKASPEHDDYEDSYSIETENGQQQVTDEDFTASGKFENETKKIGGDIPESSGHNHVEEPHSTRNRQQQLPDVDHGSIENTNSTTAAVRGQRKKCDNVDEDQSRNITRKQDVQKCLKAIEPIGSSNEECLKMFNSEEKKKYLDISPNTVSTVNYSNTECIESGIEKTSVVNHFENVKYSATKNTFFQPDNSSDNDIRECIDVDDDRDKDSISTDSSTRKMDMDETNTFIPSLAEEIKKNESEKQKSTRCKFCDEDVNTKNFTRHIERKHSSNSEVIELLKLPKNSKERRNKFILLRNDTNFNLYIKGTTRPNRKNKTHIENDELYYPCAYCKGLFKKRYLSRHAKCCIVNTNNERNHCSASQTLTACAMDTTNVISKLNVKHQVFDLMKPDEVSMEVKKDLLIIHFGESFLRKHRRERMHYTCSSRMRELSRLLIAYRKISGEEKCSLKDMIVPKKFGMVLSAVRDITGYDTERRTYKAPSLAMHLGTTLKQASHELKTLVLQESEGFKCGPNKSSREWIGEIQDFIKLIESRWTRELSSLAYKDLQEGKWNDQILIPLVDDIRKFKEESIKLAEQCVQDFINNIDEKKTYTTLVHCSLVLLNLFNRSRIGDVQILKIKDYKCHHETDFAVFQNVLTESEKLLTREYRKVVNSGKGSRGKVILIPKVIQKFIDLLLEKRGKYIPSDNEYVFASPGSSTKWEKADVAFREMTKKINLRHPESIGSNKWRKHIATTMQILNLTKEEMKQFSNFMGYTEKSNAEFDELPVDIYETAKLAKILMMMDRSLPAELKGKSLSDMNVDLVSTSVEENDEEGNNCKTPQKRKASMDTVLKDDGESNEITEGKSKRNKIIKKVWTDEEIKILLREFGSHIKERTYPSAAKIQQMLEKTKMRRNVKIVKSKLQHLMRKNII
ncbi:uncharacterized protein LOC123319818 isoform X2 [Coccinella septempunctata]|uniref:uncharacterized protein LOC123319818 isoform X2 n=1 Tax=Coccinella septempunctata TaxID=41139 RepID=UPI001D08D83A|nr:uncharacterized protein LOC123319818 isoform X2 [Coccinella septempunctata]